MENQNSLRTEWSNHELIHPLDFSYPRSGFNNLDLDTTSSMGTIIPNNPFFSSMNTLPVPTLHEAGILDGKDGDFGVPSQESMVNPFYFPSQELSMMNPVGVPNQEMPMIMNTSGFSFQAPPVPSTRLALSREIISQHFYKPIDQAAIELNIGKTLLKIRCRELGIPRWPYRKLMSIQTTITNLQNILVNKSSGDGAEEILEAITQLENERKEMEETPDLKLSNNMKRLRQACFKSNYKRKKKIERNERRHRRQF